jgi:hypothetical protein
MEKFSIFVESLKRLYENEKITEDKIILLFNNDKLTKEEKEYILNQ